MKKTLYKLFVLTDTNGMDYSFYQQVFKKKLKASGVYSNEYSEALLVIVRYYLEMLKSHIETMPGVSVFMDLSEFIFNLQENMPPSMLKTVELGCCYTVGSGKIKNTDKPTHHYSIDFINMNEVKTISIVIQELDERKE